MFRTVFFGYPLKQRSFSMILKDLSGNWLFQEETYITGMTGSGGIPLATYAKLTENLEVFPQKINALMEDNDFGE